MTTRTPIDLDLTRHGPIDLYDAAVIKPGDQITTDLEHWITVIQARSNPATKLRALIDHDRIPRHLPMWGRLVHVRAWHKSELDVELSQQDAPDGPPQGLRYQPHHTYFERDQLQGAGSDDDCPDVADDASHATARLIDPQPFSDHPGR